MTITCSHTDHPAEMCDECRNELLANTAREGFIDRFGNRYRLNPDTAEWEEEVPDQLVDNDGGGDYLPLPQPVVDLNDVARPSYPMI